MRHKLEKLGFEIDADEDLNSFLMHNMENIVGMAILYKDYAAYLKGRLKEREEGCSSLSGSGAIDYEYSMT